VGKLKKVGMGIGVIAVIYVIAVYFGFCSGCTGPLSSDERYDNMMMSDSELSAMAVDWNYKDLLRNIDDYTGKIIFVDGKVGFVARDRGELQLCTSTNNPNFSDYTCRNNDFIVKVNGIDSWIEKDRLQGYVEVTGEFWNNSDPKVKEIKLTCSNC
jgi:hypothetical protein